ncbi:MAG TPA: AlkA N-terminal domain-containing protein [Solirubrobacteraceae bacterium]|nr:AlkA N-terminal domain-containing protein [Solirubrobacteraceae bacterium]
MAGSSAEVCTEVTPPWPFRLPTHGGVDGVLRYKEGVLERLLHHGEQPVVVRVAQPSADRVVFDASAPTSEAAEHGIARMRFALGVDEDLRAFHTRFARDPLIGASVRRRPWLRVRRRPEPWEALAWAVCEQLIEFERAAAIERRIVRRLGRSWPAEDGPASRSSAGARPGRTSHDGQVVARADEVGTGARRSRAREGRNGDLRDVPTPAALAGVAPALLQSLDLGGARARTLVRVAREVARGRIDLHSPDHERTWQRLRAIPGIGSWTVEMLALHGQGRHDQVPAGDVGLLKLVGRALSGGKGGWASHPRAQEAEVREFFAPYEEWAGLAVVHMMSM